MKKIVLGVVAVTVALAAFGLQKTLTTHAAPAIPSTVADISFTVPATPDTLVTWTAPGDNGTVGTAASYDIRYSTSPLQSDTQCLVSGALCTRWTDASRVPNVPAPHVAGTYERAMIYGLNGGTQYYIGIKTTSQSGGVSPLSNVAFFTLFPTAPSYNVVNTHPRIWLTPTVLTYLKGQMQAGSPQWLNLKSLADAVLPYADPTSPLYNPARFTMGGPNEWSGLDFALVYQMTGNTTYAKAALEVINANLASTDFTDHVRCPINDNRWAHYTLPIAMDWIYNTLSSTTIASIESQFLFHADQCGNINNIKFGNLANFNEYEGGIRYEAMVGLAAYGDTPAAKAYIDLGFDSTFEGLTWPQYLATKMQGGLDSEGPEYGPGNVWSGNYLWQALYTATGIDEFSTPAGQQFLKNNVQLMFSMMSSGTSTLRGNGKIIPALGDIEKGNNVPQGGFATYDVTPFGTVSSQDYHNAIQFDYYRLPKNSQASQWAKYLLDNDFLSDCALNNRCGGANSYGAPQDVPGDFLFYDPSGASDNYNLDAPLDTVANGPGIALFRSGWGGSETVVDFSAMWKGTDHDDGDANEFEIMKNGQFLNKNTYGYDAYFIPSDKHNTMVLGPSDAISSGSQFQYTLAGGKIGRAGVGGADLINFSTSTTYSYAVGDATDLYNVEPQCYMCAPYNRVNTFIRELVYLRPNTVVEFDRVSLPSASYQQNWNDHSAYIPTQINANTLTQTSKDKTEQLFTHINWPLNPQISFVNQIGAAYLCSSGVNSCDYGWRTTVTPTVPSTNPYFLTTLYAADANVPSMPASINVDAGKMIGVFVNDATGPSVVLFSTSPSRTAYTTDLSTPVNYSIPATTLTVSHHLVDMPANFPLNVYQGTTKLGTITTNNAGILDFTSQGGGSFTVQAGAGLPVPPPVIPPPVVPPVVPPVAPPIVPSSTPPGVDTVRPSIAWISPATGSSISGSVTLTVSSTDNVAVSTVSIYYNTISAATLLGTKKSTGNTVLYSVVLSSPALGNGNTTFIAVSTDSSHNTSTASIAVKINNVAGLPTPTPKPKPEPGHTPTSTPPVVSTALPTISSFTASSPFIPVAESVRLYWTVANASSVTITPGSFTTNVLVGNTVVRPNATTTYTLSATNKNGTTKKTVTVNIDTTAPTVPAKITSHAVSTSEIDLSWSGSTDNVAVKGYYIYRNGTVVATTSATSYKSTGLSASSIYNYLVRSYDAAYNISPRSSSTVATTLSAPPSAAKP